MHSKFMKKVLLCPDPIKDCAVLDPFSGKNGTFHRLSRVLNYTHYFERFGKIFVFCFSYFPSEILYNLDMKLNIVPYLIVLSFCYCASLEYRDPNDVQGTKQWGVMEVRETVQNMSASLSEFYKKDPVKGYIELRKFKNNTSEHIDTKILANEIVTNLTSNKVPFVDISQRKESLDEISLNKSGITSSDTKLEFGKLKSPSYRLSGELNDLVNYEKGKKIQYILITLRLTSVESNEIVWQADKKFLKISDTEGYGL